MASATIDIRSPRLRRLLEDWESRRRGREFPARADFSPFDIKYILGNLSLIEVEHDPLRFRYRIHTSNLAQQLSVEWTGKYVDTLPRQDIARVAVAHFTEAVERRAPVLQFHGGYNIEMMLPRDCEFLVLPLSSDGARIDMLMSAFDWELPEKNPDGPAH